MYEVELASNDIDAENIKWIGYERNANGKILPKTSDMAASMDPEK